MRKVYIIMMLLPVLLFGCSNTNESNETVGTTAITDTESSEEPATEVQTKSRVTYLDGGEYEFKWVQGKTDLPFKDFLDTEEEFFLPKWGEVKFVYVYLFTDEEYEKRIYSVNYEKNGNIGIDLPDGVTAMYVLCPDYTVVDAATKTDSPYAEEIGTYEIIEHPGEEVVGGNLLYRISQIDTVSAQKIEYTIWDTSPGEEDNTFGGYSIELK